MEQPWYKSYFGQRYLDAYLHALTQERTMAEVDGIEALLALPPGSKILDLCCGHGRHLLELANRGYLMTGLDLDPLFLEMARREADRRGLQVRLERRDMRDIPFTEEFDAVINVFTSFGYLESDAEDQRVLDAVARALKVAGLFCMEILARDSLVRVFQRRGWQETPEGVKVLEERRFNFLEGRNYVRQVVIYPDGTQKEASHVWRAYTLTELVKMFRATGLTIETTYGGLDQSPLTLESSRLVLLARKG